MSLPDLVGLMEALGATEALNLDGGGSSVMVIRGQVVSRPSDMEGERPVANALAVRKDPAFCASK
jgi:exopolysaccharide biosynthesis protein